MDKHLLARHLEGLYSDGQALAKSSSTDAAAQVSLWFARTAEALRFFLPSDSELLAAFKRLSDATADAKPTSILEQALTLLRVATDLNRLRRGDDAIADLRQDVSTIISQIYVKSWWFRIPVAILLVAVIFAVFGVVQLKDYQVDIAAIADKAVEEAHDRIDEQEKTVQASIAAIGKSAEAAVDEAKRDVARRLDQQLQASLKEAQDRIATTAQSHVNTLIRDKAPGLETQLLATRAIVDTISIRLTPIQDQVSRLKAGTAELTRGLQRLDSAAATGAFTNLSVFLGRSRTVVAIELAVTTLALVASVAMLAVLGVKRWRHT